MDPLYRYLRGLNETWTPSVIWALSGPPCDGMLQQRGDPEGSKFPAPVRSVLHHPTHLACAYGQRCREVRNKENVMAAGSAVPGCSSSPLNPTHGSFRCICARRSRVVSRRQWCMVQSFSAPSSSSRHQGKPARPSGPPVVRLGRISLTKLPTQQAQ